VTNGADGRPDFRPKTGEIPTDPGVYRWRDAEGRVIYVGKAKNLRNRLTNYFQDPSRLHPRTRQMVATAHSLEWTVVQTDAEAFALEYTWIKQFEPRFNIKYRDDKTYPYLAVTLAETYPRAMVMRGAKKPGNRYFGPFAHAWAIRDTLDQLLRVFPIRTCSRGVFQRSGRAGRPCLLGYIDKCSAPCVGRISEADHRGLAEDLCAFLAGDTQRFLRRVRAEMREAAAAEDYERAARLRDDAAALERVVERNAIVLPGGTDADVFALAGDELEAAAQVFFVRDGRVRGQRGWVVEKVEDIGDAGLVEQLLETVYGEAASEVPGEVLVPALPAGAADVEAWLEAKRGGRVSLRVPQRGAKKAIQDTVLKNAQQALKLHKSRRSGDLTTRSQALRELQDYLGLDEAPLRIESYDISHTQGTNQVASMVVFEDGLARKAEYRRFRIRGEDGTGARDDTAAMDEVLTRRFARLLQTGDASTGESFVEPEAATGSGRAEGGRAGGEPGAGGVVLAGEVRDGDEAAGGPAADRKKAKSFHYRPNLVVVDGGLPQVNAAARALAALGVENVALAGLAKRLEEVWLPGEDFPVILPRASQGLYLLQRVRDEAHRFAITYHRQRRAKSMTASALDAVPGLGPARGADLMKHFGSLKKIRAATEEQLAEVKGIGPALAKTIHATLAQA
jgi:excinuclease ABC subunit C